MNVYYYVAMSKANILHNSQGKKAISWAFLLALAAIIKFIYSIFHKKKNKKEVYLFNK